MATRGQGSTHCVRLRNVIVFVVYVNLCVFYGVFIYFLGVEQSTEDGIGGIGGVNITHGEFTALLKIPRSFQLIFTGTRTRYCVVCTCSRCIFMYMYIHGKITN